MDGSWHLVDESGAAGDLHASSAAALYERPARRQVRVLRAESRALVLGSNQPDSMFDPAAMARAGLEVARRRSGGSAVLVGPGEVLWVDVVVPAGDPLWDDDVSRASWWVGEAWAAALAPALATAGVVAPVEVWKGPMRRTPWSPAICFAGLGPGEVTVGGAKVVGISQRRLSGAALLQTAALLRWQPSDYTSLLRHTPEGADPVALAGTAAAIGRELEKPVLEALLEHLARRMP